MTPLDQLMGLQVSNHDPPGTPDASVTHVRVFWMLLTAVPGAQRSVLMLEMPLSGSPQITESKPLLLNDTNLQVEDQLPPAEACITDDMCAMSS